MDSCIWPHLRISSGCYYPASSPHPDTLRSNLIRLLRDVLAAHPSDCHFDSPELQESWPRSLCCRARHNRPQRAALEEHIREWLPGFGLQALPCCQPSPQQCSCSWPLMSRCMGSGLSSGPCLPRPHRGAPEFGSTCRWCSLGCVVTFTPTADAAPPH